ncbi:MAG: AEC family transporter [Clostridia bacterium]|nr:AEC family transporter [Clostridia bacterium]
MHSFLLAVNGVLPIIILIALGYFLKRYNVVNDNFASVASKVCFKVLLPCTLFVNIYSVERLSNINWVYILFCVVAVLALFCIGLLISKYVAQHNNQRGVLTMSAFRSNSVIIGLNLVIFLYGTEGGAYMSASLAFIIPLFIALSVTSLSMFSEQGERVTVGSVIKRIIKNPLIIAIALAFVALGVRSMLIRWGGTFRLSNIDFIYDSISTLGSVTTPLALIVLGAQFKFESARHLIKQISVGALLRLVVSPLMVFCVALIFFPSFGKIEYACLLCLFASPNAVTNVILTSELGGDEQLAGQLVVWTTVCSFVTLFVYIFTFSQLGII